MSKRPAPTVLYEDVIRRTKVKRTKVVRTSYEKAYEKSEWGWGCKNFFGASI